MKKIFSLSIIILYAISSFAQSSNPKAMEMIRQMQNPKGKIMLVIEGKTCTEKSSFFQNPKGAFVISTDLASAHNTFAIVLPKKESGTYPFATDKKQNTVFLMETGVSYEVKSGTITLNNSGGKISGTFTGKAQKFRGKQGNLKPQGDLIPFSGSFSGLSI